MNILVTGATGFLGSDLLRSLPTEIQNVSILTRTPSKPTHSPKINAYRWDPEREVAPATALGGIDVVVHLAGENVGAGRWSESIKRKILDSRRLVTRNLVAGINAMERPPVFISASAIGFYGSSGDTILTEDSPRGSGFLAEVCEIWENEAKKAKVSRLVIPRFGVVLGPGGGALGKMLPIFKTGLGGRTGDGKQWMGWIHREDAVKFLIQALTDPNLEGVYNLVAPEPIRNEAFAKTLGHVLHRPAILPAPAFALKMAFGEMADETILASNRVLSPRLKASGFNYKYPTLEGALQQITTP